MADHDNEREIMAARMAKMMEGQTPERIAERKRTSARCGHIKRKLREGKRLEGELLEFALDIVPDDMGRKLKAGEKLGDYETHLLFDVYLLHARLR